MSALFYRKPPPHWSVDIFYFFMVGSPAPLLLSPLHLRADPRPTARRLGSTRVFVERISGLCCARLNRPCGRHLLLASNRAAVFRRGGDVVRVRDCCSLVVLGSFLLSRRLARSAMPHASPGSFLGDGDRPWDRVLGSIFVCFSPAHRRPACRHNSPYGRLDLLGSCSWFPARPPGSRTHLPESGVGGSSARSIVDLV